MVRKDYLIFTIFILMWSFVFAVEAHASSKEDLIIINKSTNQLAFFQKGTLVRVFDVATGSKPSYTPEGSFKIANKVVKPSWKGIPGGSPKNPLGDRWMGLNIRKGITYGIHGNNNPSSIGKYASKGCIRMHNKEVRWLFDRVSKNTRVIITSSKKSFRELAQSHGYSLKEDYFKSKKNLTVYKKEKGEIVKIGTINKGVVFKKKKSEGKWIYIDFGGVEGLVSKSSTKIATKSDSKTIKLGKEQVQFNTMKEITIYSKASSKATTLGKIRKGQTLTGAEESKKWVKIIVGNRVGYVKKSEVEEVK